MITRTFLAPRANQERSPTAVIQLEEEGTEPNLEREDVLEALQKSVAIWAEAEGISPPTGFQSVTVGGLLNRSALQSESFIEAMKAEGIYNFRIQTPETIFQYDKPLGLYMGEPAAEEKAEEVIRAIEHTPIRGEARLNQEVGGLGGKAPEGKMPRARFDLWPAIKHADPRTVIEALVEENLSGRKTDQLANVAQGYSEQEELDALFTVSRQGSTLGVHFGSVRTKVIDELAFAREVGRRYGDQIEDWHLANLPSATMRTEVERGMPEVA
jgi:hypothetical protein